MHIFCLEKVKLPAEQEDWLKRPAYIKNNAAGVPICDNRCAIALCFLLFAKRSRWLAGCSILYRRAQFFEKGLSLNQFFSSLHRLIIRESRQRLTTKFWYVTMRN